MTDIGKAYVQIIPKAEGISDKISKIVDPESEKAGKSGGIKLGSALVTALGSAAVVTGIKQFFSTALDLGGELQQNLGGTEAVFGEFAQSLQTSASEAYKNMGLSASDYMATANKMGSLFQGSGIEQQKSLEMTTEAMQRAADVASVMGLDTQMAMDSIAGAAKGNFTMMDNLGVAMNATTLEAYALEKGVNFKWNTASNAEKAELAMKMFMDRTSQYAGNFVRESEQTLSGSISATKAAFEDLFGALALGQDISQPLTNLLSSVGNLLIKNVFPMVMNIVKALPPAISQAIRGIAPMFQESFGTISEAIGPAVEQIVPKFEQFIKNALNNLPGILETGANIISNIGNGIIQALPTIITTAAKIGTQLISGLMQAFPKILEAGWNIIINLVNGIIQNLPAIAEAAFSAIISFGAAILQNLPTILQKGIEIIGQLVAGLISAIPNIIRAIPQIIKSIVNAFSQFNWLSIGTDIIKGIAKGISNAVGIIVDAAKNAAKAAFDAAKNFLGIGSPSKLFAKGVGKWIPAGIAQGIQNNTGVLQAAMDNLAAMTSDGFGASLASGKLSVGAYESDGAVSAGYSQVINIYSPRELSPSEVARQTRNATQQMALQLSGV